MCRESQFSLERILPIKDDQLVYFRHLMFDDQRQVIFCFVPKVIYKVASYYELGRIIF